MYSRVNTCFLFLLEKISIFYYIIHSKNRENAKFHRSIHYYGILNRDNPLRIVDYWTFDWIAGLLLLAEVLVKVSCKNEVCKDVAI